MICFKGFNYRLNKTQVTFSSWSYRAPISPRVRRSSNPAGPTGRFLPRNTPPTSLDPTIVRFQAMKSHLFPSPACRTHFPKKPQSPYLPLTAPRWLLTQSLLLLSSRRTLLSSAMTAPAPWSKAPTGSMSISCKCLWRSNLRDEH